MQQALMQRPLSTTLEAQMTERERRSRSKDASHKDEAQTTETGETSEVAEKIDDLLDEIDTVLEENAEEFVKNYVQKGGE